jgi:hypothetical protein
MVSHIRKGKTAVNPTVIMKRGDISRNNIRDLSIVISPAFESE